MDGKVTKEGKLRMMRRYGGDLAAKSCLTLMTPLTAAPGSSVPVLQAGHWSGLPVSSPGDLPDPGIEPGSPALQADSLLSEPPGKHNRVPQRGKPVCH